MRMHPGLFMLTVWSSCILLYLLLPFQLVEKSLSVFGIIVFILFLGSFALGTLLVRKPSIRYQVTAPRRLDFSRSDKYIKIVSLCAVVACFVDLQGKDLFDLAAAYSNRSERASALLHGEASNSSMAFQIAFLTYPAGFVYLVRHIVFEDKIKSLQIFIFGLLPIIMATISMGGRAPILYALIIAIFAFKAKKHMQRDEIKIVSISRLNYAKPFKLLLMLLIPSLALYYFSAVFFIRAEVAGGVSGMFDLAESIWGISFRGANSELLFDLVGESFAYLIFVFSWYLIQGFFMSNFLFTDYNGSAQLGVYGIDLMSALMRRLDGDVVANNFEALLELGTYGFLPSAFGSLFVDFWFAGLLVCAIWGWLAAIVYQKIRFNLDARWYLLAPFITMGILFSLINTPIGFTNGLVTHIWLLVAFYFAVDVGAKKVTMKNRKNINE